VGEALREQGFPPVAFGAQRHRQQAVGPHLQASVPGSWSMQFQKAKAPKEEMEELPKSGEATICDRNR
jgi:hypothetical protein